jgi:hypothetical protein
LVAVVGSSRSPDDLNKQNDEKLQNVHHFYTENIFKPITLFTLMHRATLVVDEMFCKFIQRVGWWAKAYEFERKVEKKGERLSVA